MSDLKEPKTVDDLISILYEKHKDDKYFNRYLNDDEIDSEIFAVRYYSSIGRLIETSYLSKGNEMVFIELESLGCDSLNDMANFILMKLYDYSKGANIISEKEKADKILQEEAKQQEKEKFFSVDDLVASYYEDWKTQSDFINDVKSLDADSFAIRLHDGFGRTVRNDYLWTNKTAIFNECLMLGYQHPDDMSNYILTELHKYAKQKIMENGNEENKTDKPEENKTEQETSQNEFEGLHVLDWLKLEKEYPLAIQALKDWFLTKYDIPDVEVVTEQYTMLLTNGKAGVYLNPRDLYDFFDGWDVRPFVVPEEQFPKVKYLIQSKKSFKESEEVFEERGAAEIASFVKTFFYIEVTIEHERKIEDK